MDDVLDVCSTELLNKKPLVSVQMLAYRHGKFIEQAIRGVICQECDFDFELVIAEDCSPDNTLEIARKYQEQYPGIIRIITGPGNVGMHRNAGRSFQLCRGRYIALCEGDDYWHHPRKLQMQIDLLESDKEMMVCHTDFDRLTRFRRRTHAHRSRSRMERPAVGRAYLSLLRTWSVMTATAVYRKDVVDEFAQSPFSARQWPFADLNLLLFCSLQGTVGYVDESTATFRKMRGSAGNNGIQAALKMQLAAEDCVRYFFESHPVPQKDWIQVVALRKWNIYTPAYYAGRSDLMQECFDWLAANDFKPSFLKHRLHLFSIDSGFYKIHGWGRQIFINYLSAIAP